MSGGVELAGHPAADVGQLRVDGGLERRQATTAQGAEAITNLEQFIEVFGDHQDRRAGIAQGNQRPVNGRGRADVHAPGRVRGHQQFWLLEDFPAEDEFLQIAAGQAARQRPGIGSLHPETADNLFGQCLDFAALDQAFTYQPLLKSREEGVVGQAQLRYRAVTQAFGGHERQAEFTAGIRAQMGDGLSGETEGRAGISVQSFFTAEQRQQLILTVTRDPGDPNDFTAAHFKMNILQRATERVRVMPGQSAHV